MQRLVIETPFSRATPSPRPAARLEMGFDHQPKIHAELSGDEVRRWLHERIAGYKVPKVVTLHAQLPREDTGKVFECKLPSRTGKGGHDGCERERVGASGQAHASCVRRRRHARRDIRL